MGTKRAFSLDALRGYAIVTMVLSGTVAYKILPGWMYHAQLPPPLHKFDPSVYGISWVDLVFPFFLFAMGAAFPFSIGKKLEKGVAMHQLLFDAFDRGAKLTFFAIFIQHLYPWVLESPQTPTAWLTSIGAFGLMFPMFMRLPWSLPSWLRPVIQYGAFGIGLLLLYYYPYSDGRVFDPSFSNIIILVLANMALFGSIIYLFTYRHPWRRVLILPFVMAVFLGSSTEGSWVKELFNYSPLPWFYKFYYLKYLFIVIPGSIAGEYLSEWLRCKEDNVLPQEGGCVQQHEKQTKLTPFILLLSMALVVWNLYGLYTRQLLLNLAGSVAMIGALYLLLRGAGTNSNYWRKLFTAGSYLLLLGLFFEAFEGGIRKDHSTYSYYFVTAGLAFMAMISLSIICDVYKWRKLSAPFEQVGQNPMIAYVATSMVIMPLLNLLGLSTYLELLQSTPWLGFFKGVLLTSMTVGLTCFFVRIKWFWRT